MSRGSAASPQGGNAHISFEKAVERFPAARIPHGNGKTIHRELLLVADHNAYHKGEFAFARQMMGTWTRTISKVVAFKFGRAERRTPMPTTQQNSMRDLFRRLAALEALPVPENQPGIMLHDGTLPGSADSGRSTVPLADGARRYVPVLSVYLDLRPQIDGARPAERPARVILRERLHQIEQTFAPRGVAFDAVRAGADEIERYLDSQVAAAAPGVALFVSQPHHLFETLITDRPLETQVVASAVPDLFQLARALTDEEVAVVAVAEVNAARLFLLHQGGLHELRQVVDDPKYYHMVRGANAMSQAHYQRHAVQMRDKFAGELAKRIELLVASNPGSQVILVGEVEALPLVREALSPSVSRLVREIPRSLGSAEFSASADTIFEEIEPLLQQAKAEQERSVVDRLVQAIQADGLGVAGLEATRRALSSGQVETLILQADRGASPEMSVETRTELIKSATKTGADIAIVDSSPQLEHLGGVGALLRYRTLQEM